MIEENAPKILDILDRAVGLSDQDIAAHLNDEEKQRLLKVLYIGLAKPENNGKLLSLFNRITESTNIGTVVRAVNSL